MTRSRQTTREPDLYFFFKHLERLSETICLGEKKKRLFWMFRALIFLPAGIFHRSDFLATNEWREREWERERERECFLKGCLFMLFSSLSAENTYAQKIRCVCLLSQTCWFLTKKSLVCSFQELHHFRLCKRGKKRVLELPWYIKKLQLLNWSMSQY